MDRAESETFFERLLAGLPGWVFTLSGLTLLAVALLTPAWVEYREMAWQAQVMQAQAGQINKQEDAYRQFAEALSHDDPVLIQRMAFYHLRLKPVGTKLIGQTPVGAARLALPVRAPIPGTAPGIAPGTAAMTPKLPPWRSLPTVEDLLKQPMPDPPAQCAEEVAPDSRVVQLMAGPCRYVMFAAGLLCLYVGLLPKTVIPSFAPATQPQAIAATPPPPVTA